MDATMQLLQAAQGANIAPGANAMALPANDPTMALLQTAHDSPWAGYSAPPLGTTSVRASKTPDLGFGAYLGHELSGGILDKAAAAAGATFPSLGPMAVNAPTWGERYHDTLTNIRGGLSGFQADNPKQAKAALAASVTGPMLIGGGESSLLGSMLKGSTIGGAYGFGGTNDDSVMGDLTATGLGVAAGAGMAGAGHAAGTMAGNAAGAVVDRLTGNTQTRGQKSAAQMLADTLKQQGIGADELTTQLQGNKPLTPMDVGGDNSPLARLGRMITVLPGKPGQDVTSFLNTRQTGAPGVQGQRGRVLGDISQLAPDTDTYGNQGALSQERSVNSNPLYQQAFSNPAVMTDRLAQFQADPDIQAGMARGIKIQRRNALAAGEPFNNSDYAITSWNAAGDPVIGPTPSWKTWHAGREGLDAQIEDFRDPVTGVLPPTKNVISLQNLRRGLNSQLTTLNPDLAAADAAWSGPSQKKDAIRMGQKLLNADPEQITAAQTGMNAETIPYHQMGAGRALRDVANDTRDNNNIPLRLNGDQTTRDQIGAMFGPNAGANFSSNMDLENQMARTRQFVTGGSNTANKAADVAASGAWHLPTIINDAITGFAAGGPKGALVVPGIGIAKRSSANILGGLLNNEDRNAELAKVLTATGSDAGNKVQNLLTPAQQRQRAVAIGKLIGGAGGRGATALSLGALMSPTANNTGQ